MGSTSEPLELSKLPENHDPMQPYKVEKFDDGLSYDTLQVHAGHRPDKETHARAVPIYNSVVCKYSKPEILYYEVSLTLLLSSRSFSQTVLTPNACAPPRRPDTFTAEFQM